MAKKRKQENNLPELYMCCGKDDYLHQDNVVYRELLKSLNINFIYEEDDGYDHSWKYWDIKIQRVLEWMKI